MSASAGKVMPRPMGDYNASTEYKILDIVTYNDRPYMAKQTTTGNTPIEHPTAQNPDSYWMLLLDFPTDVDNVPTQNSDNLVKSGGVYNAVAAKMDADASNVTNLAVGRTTGSQSSIYVDISKDAGESQPVTLTVTSTSYPAAYYANELSARIGDSSVAYIDSGRKYLTIQSVTIVNDKAVATAYLVEDNTAAISLTNESLDYKNYAKENKSYNVINGVQNATTADSARLTGKENSVTGDYGTAEGTGCSVAGVAAHAEGKNTFASGSYAHAEGDSTVASGTRSHAAGEHTVAGYGNQFVVGYYNNNKDTVFEVGAGSSGARKNAFEVYSSGAISCNDGTDKYKFAKVSGKDGFYDGSGNFHAIQLYKELVNSNVTLSTSADTTVTFSDAAITTDSDIIVLTSVFGLCPTNVVTTTGSCTVTFAKASSAQTIAVKIKVE